MDYEARRKPEKNVKKKYIYIYMCVSLKIPPRRTRRRVDAAAGTQVDAAADTQVDAGTQVDAADTQVDAADTQVDAADTQVDAADTWSDPYTQVDAAAWSFCQMQRFRLAHVARTVSQPSL